MTWVAADVPLRGLAAGAAGRAAGSRRESTRVPLGGVSRPTGAAGALRKPAPGAAGPWTRRARLGAPGAHLRTLRALCGPDPSRRGWP